MVGSVVQVVGILVPLLGLASISVWLADGDIRVVDVTNRCYMVNMGSWMALDFNLTFAHDSRDLNIGLTGFLVWIEKHLAALSSDRLFTKSFRIH